MCASTSLLKMITFSIKPDMFPEILLVVNSERETAAKLILFKCPNFYTHNIREQDLAIISCNLQVTNKIFQLYLATYK